MDGEDSLLNQSDLNNSSLAKNRFDEDVSSIGYHSLSNTNNPSRSSIGDQQLDLKNQIGENTIRDLSDLNLENKLLRSELSSMNQELSNLLRRNHRSSEEIKKLTNQVWLI